MVELKLDAVLSETGGVATHAYFPLEGFVSVIFQTAGASAIEVAIVGNEGMFNTELILGVAQSNYKSRVLGSGRALLIQRRALSLRRAEDASLRELLLRYVQVRENQLARKIACMNSHSVEQRLAKALLMLRDRAHSKELFITQEALGVTLGVRRESVSKAANTFQDRGLMSYGRGYVVLQDEAGLEVGSCACYQADWSAYKHTLGI